MSRTNQRTERLNAIFKDVVILRASGYTLGAIAIRHNVTRERVRQILSKDHPWREQ